MFSILLIAFALAMDCFAVSLSLGASKKLETSDKIKISSFFGLFQSGMTLGGFFIGGFFEKIIESFDYWIAFILLLIIGAKMIYEFWKGEGSSHDAVKINTKTLLILSLATSIDAVGAGFSFAFLKNSIMTAALIIGLVSFSPSIIGVFMGQRLNKLLGKKAELAGGLVLIAIGIKILCEHL